MIQINLLPGAGKKTRTRGPSLNLSGALAKAIAQVTDPFLLSAVAAMIVAGLAISGMFLYQQTKTASVDGQIQAAEQDSIRFAAVIRERKKAELERDSVEKQLTIIRSIDNKRYVWPHVMDEVSRALPAYTWVTQLTQISADPSPNGGAPLPAAKGDSTKPKHKSVADVADSLQTADKVRFRIVGNTVDLQALTRFMKLLEASPFIENVQLVKSAMILSEGKEVTEFQLECAYQIPDSAAIKTVPLTLSTLSER